MDQVTLHRRRPFLCVPFIARSVGIGVDDNFVTPHCTRSLVFVETEEVLVERSELPSRWPGFA